MCEGCMTNSLRKLMRQQLQETIDAHGELVNLKVPQKGWIRAIRDSLGISTRALAERLKCSQANVVGLEKREADQSISLGTLEKLAEAMNCKLVYCIVPLEPLDQILENQARKVVKHRTARVNHSMVLEQQGLTVKQRKAQENILVDQLLHGSPKKLWRSNED